MKVGDDVEDKNKICALLLKAVQATDNAWDCEALNYEKLPNGDEQVTVIWESGGKRIINVSMDSGTAMIRDIMNNLGV